MRCSLNDLPPSTGCSSLSSRSDLTIRGLGSISLKELLVPLSLSWDRSQRDAP